MKFKTYNHPLPWTDREDWLWPAGDRKLVQVFDHVADIDVFMEYVEGRDVCVQAGGACGVWPLRYSQLFGVVHTFEPQPENYHCLLENTADAANVVIWNAPLSDAVGRYSIHNDIHERENWGAGYCIPDPLGLVSMRIDDLGLEACDLIQLDIEGFELKALIGAAETIDAYRPTIVLEEKPLNHVIDKDPAEPRKWLERNFGYELVRTVHRDVILC